VLLLLDKGGILHHLAFLKTPRGNQLSLFHEVAVVVPGIQVVAWGNAKPHHLVHLKKNNRTTIMFTAL
jgi:hypothetical protein